MKAVKEKQIQKPNPLKVIKPLQKTQLKQVVLQTKENKNAKSAMQTKAEAPIQKTFTEKKRKLNELKASNKLNKDKPAYSPKSKKPKKEGTRSNNPTFRQEYQGRD